jgi:uridine phosphorylase
MALIKDKYPILEHDEDKDAVIMPNRKGLADLPSKCAVSFSDAVYKFADEIGAEVVSEFDTCTKLFRIYKTRYEDQDVCFCEVPLGASASVALLDFLFAYGVKYIVASGSCGVLVDIPENELLVPVRALRDEGASYHYLMPERFVEINEIALESIRMAITNRSLKFDECVTWTTDGFYRETKQMVAYRKAEGCQVVEMECSAMAACAQFRDAVFGQILYSGDSLADVEQHDGRGWGESSKEIAFRLSLDAVLKMGNRKDECGGHNG